MAGYIEIEQLWKCETCYHNDQYGCTLGLGCDHGESYRPAYRKLKKADVAPVVHGKWISHDFDVTFSCSKCDFTTDYRLSNYCPKCGARMDGE